MMNQREYNGVYDNIAAIKASFGDDENEETMHMSASEYITFLNKEDILIIKDKVCTVKSFDSPSKNNETINML